MKICKVCVQNELNDPDFQLDENGVCNYCIDVESEFKRIENYPSQFQSIIEKIKSDGKGKQYDCVMGMSGGVDSSYVAHLAKMHGLRPLVVHFDNGWNTELAVDNINKIITKNGFDLHTLVVDWDEFRDIQKAFIRSDVVDIEMVSDHAITATMLKISKKFGIKYALSGSNVATESGMPISWSWRKADWMNIKDIHSKFGEVKIKTFPRYSSFDILFNRLKGDVGIESITILDYIDFKKLEAIEVLKREYDWREYPGKHYESFFTKFYQAYILPEKFKVDKRISHYSALIRNGEMTREDVLVKLEEPLYTVQELRNDIEYFCKKIGFDKSEFEEIMKRSPKPHDFYKSDEKYFRVLAKYWKIIKKIPILNRIGLRGANVKRVKNGS
ncbi:MAG: ExsB family protein [Rheinheimera sp.]|uniref:N-acetyl sugar amidotransferase n=1 Tax=Arsukibacterium sp. UBA3155 TaxID=1946058 RepID=UPI000C8DA908|nr:N-acetyl sugar amidotransferase [Arsukibacterium sp. UBA3155]MAD74886.1 ExsB family protein [Rheinheimera sp.]|tara:strand:- start:125726 stop:126883 length:1158 start_codon:yes stop_codon:yes gene_type:complete